jgi:hypothetical protein
LSTINQITERCHVRIILQTKNFFSAAFQISGNFRK